MLSAHHSILRGPLAAWITGWSNWLGQVTGAPSVNYGTAAMILASASIQNPSYVPTEYQTFLLTVFIMLIHGCMASMPTRWIARVNSAGSTFNIIALVVVIILIPAACDRTARGLSRFNPSSAVWGDIYQGTEWPNGISVLMSFIGVIWTMSGYDSPFHLSEECSNANVASPRAIFLTSAIGGVMGWFLQLVVAYTVVDISATLSSDLGQPFAAYLIQILPQKAVLAVLSLTIIAGFAMGQGCMIAASRVRFSHFPPLCRKHRQIPNPKSGHLRLRPRRLLSSLQVLETRQPAHANSRQRRLVQQRHRKCSPASHFWRRACYRRHLQHRRLRGLRRLHHPDFHSRVFRRQPFSPRTLESRTLEHSDRGRGEWVCGLDGATVVFSQRKREGSDEFHDELDGGCVWWTNGEYPPNPGDPPHTIHKFANSFFSHKN